MSVLELKSFQEVTRGHYHNQTTGTYWSSTTYDSGTTSALYVVFNNGRVGDTNKTSNTYVVAVRGGE